MALVATVACSIGPEAPQALRACASEALSIGVSLDCERRNAPPLMVHGGRRPSIVRSTACPKSFASRRVHQVDWPTYPMIESSIDRIANEVRPIGGNSRPAR
jgi:hypothetical protein